MHYNKPTTATQYEVSESTARLLQLYDDLTALEEALLSNTTRLMGEKLGEEYFVKRFQKSHNELCGELWQLISSEMNDNRANKSSKGEARLI